MTKNKKGSKVSTSQKRKSKPQKQKSSQPGIYTTLKELVPSGVQVVGDMIKPGLGTIGGMVTKKAMDLFGKVTGFGDYTITNNSLISNPTGGPPMFGPENRRFYGKEFVKTIDVPGSGDFSLRDKYYINPCNTVLFPKLSIKAQMYQQYKIHGMIIHFESTCSESVVSTNGNMSIPSVYCLTQYNLNEQDLRYEKQFLNTFFCSSKRVNKDFVHPIECDTSQSQVDVFYCWPTTPVQGYVRDPKLENFGKILIASVGGSQTNAFKAYRMFIEYDIEFFKPIYAVQPKLDDHWKLGDDVSGGVFAQAVLSDTSTTYQHLQRPYSLSGGTLTFGEECTGTYQVQLNFKYSSPQTIDIPVTGASGLDNVDIFHDDTTSILTNNGDSSTTGVYIRCFESTGGGSVTFGIPEDTDLLSGDFIISSMQGMRN